MIQNALHTVISYTSGQMTLSLHPCIFLCNNGIIIFMRLLGHRKRRRDIAGGVLQYKLYIQTSYEDQIVCNLVCLISYFSVVKSKFYTDTTVLCAKFQNDWTTAMDVMDKRGFATLCFGWFWMDISSTAAAVYYTIVFDNNTRRLLFDVNIRENLEHYMQYISQDMHVVALCCLTLSKFRWLICLIYLYSSK